ncbi:DUF4249 family protein [Anditalea andensis]|uniref:DUF4249 domain-containing protein n=1 Tax=Anditalea andensis TaxID=1048983 RepID=A0A074LFL8_9BACT|nr:DUF4249 family protein [Anditalea andensis]KEO72567.1 hypothetical protein EL17_17675 [Anditalea andensis]
MKEKFLYLIIIALLPLVSCQEEVFLELKENPSTVVIEAIWTDVSGLNQVSVSRSKGYYDSEQAEIVTDAEVYILNQNTGEKFNFQYLPQAQTYLPINNRVARPGNSYQLNVIYDTCHYQSVGITLHPPRLDSIAVDFREERPFREEGYYLTIYGDIPFTSDNNYRIRIVRNDTLLNRRNDYFLFDDEFGTEILNRGFELNGYAFKKNDRVRLELYRLNRDAFDYLNELVGLLFNDGGLFSPPPQNPTSNIKVISGGGDVLGYFMTSTVVNASLTIDED